MMMTFSPFNLVSKLAFFSLLAGLTLAGSQAQAKPVAGPAPPPVEPTTNIKMILAFTTEDGLPALVFDLKNNSDHDLTTSPVMTNYNRVYIRNEMGETRELYGLTFAPSPVIIKAGESHVEVMKLDSVFNYGNIEKSGYYRVSWQVMTDAPGAPNAQAYGSNDLVVLRGPVKATENTKGDTF